MCGFFNNKNDVCGKGIYTANVYTTQNHYSNARALQALQR